MGKVIMTVCSAKKTERFDRITVPIELKMQNGPTIDGARIHYSGGAYNEDEYTPVPTIKAGETLDVEVRLRSQWHMTIADIPRRFSFKLKSANGWILAKETINVDHAWYVSSALNKTFDPAPYGLKKFNALIFGTMGSGKSSFANSIFALMSGANSDEALPCAQPVHGSDDHCTVSLRCIDADGLPLRMWDTKGLTTENYKGPELEAIMKGSLPHGWDMDRHIDQTMLSESPDSKVEVIRFGRTPHAVVFMLPYGELDDTDGEFMQKILDQFSKIVRLGINPIVLVAKLDDADKKVRADPCASNGTKGAKLKAAAEFLGIPVGNVYPCINYLDLSKSFEIDRNLAIILHRILSMAKQRCESLQREASNAARMNDQTTLPPIYRKIGELETALAEASTRAEKGEAERVTAIARADELAEKLEAAVRGLQARDKAAQRKACICLIGIVIVASLVVVTFVAPGWFATAATPTTELSLPTIEDSRTAEDFVRCNGSVALGELSVVAATPPCLQEMEAAAGALVALVAAAKHRSTFLGTACWQALVTLVVLVGGAAWTFGTMHTTPTPVGKDSKPCSEPDKNSDSESFEEVGHFDVALSGERIRSLDP
ncbi:hypothetical protein EMIHUDRAFT_246646 [Emiliania huxleyi CCMP1516]|uniref:G domain-containing protein n=2 Tax=Emiliania huxleyi TaxID=2903 RepID=A0A0D3IR29_EMIH1|nr:hypothetical protein EMIHUDRAFT_246646 [Emiliania huxleyi CCMP1516]EOD13714.1 hypothetical protein EMIHUDRAFT_246646 [Emiliania huxleyi CCMP1516]|eukprot:XP_005766143.1 hypothetical protein EMIHUDRAFT_246646 [Emiliania huxleyi CCMP1516]